MMRASRGMQRISELEFAFRYLASPVIAVTGTNGKSTTTALIAHLLQRAGLRCAGRGQHRHCALRDRAARRSSPTGWSSKPARFSSRTSSTFTPRIGVLTNLAPDHLDRYPSVEAYYADKAQLFRNATASSVWVLNGG